MTGTGTGRQFRIRFDSHWTWLLALVGITRWRGLVSVDATHVEVRFGWFRMSIPREHIAAAGETPGHWRWGIGLHTNCTDWLVVTGSLAGLIELQLSRPQRTWILFPVHCKRLIVSLEDPAGFLAALDAKPLNRSEPSGMSAH